MLRSALSALVEHHSNASGIDQERMIFTDTCRKLIPTKVTKASPQAFSLDERVIAVTDRALYIAEWCGLPPHQQLILGRRTDLDDIESVTFSHMADDYIVINMKPQEKCKADKSHFDVSKPKRCMQTQTKFGLTTWRHHCHLTGRVYIASCVKNKVRATLAARFL